MTISALRSASFSCRVSRRSWWFSSATGSRLDLGPRFWGANAWRTTASRSRRQVVNREEYKPSRRRRAPTPPEPFARSASARIRCLYSAVKRRRLAWATTSGLGWVFGSAPVLPSVALRSPSLRSGSLRPTDGKTVGTGAGPICLFTLFTRESFSPCTVIRQRGVSQVCWHGGGKPQCGAYEVIGNKHRDYHSGS